MNKRTNIYNAIFLLAVFFITFFCIFHDENIDELMMYIHKADARYWIAAIICVIFYISSEAILIYYMMHSIKQKILIGHCFLYSFVGFFFSCITPSASGGQPAQVYYMRKDKIPIPVATLVLMIITITYKMVLVAIGTFILVIQPSEIIYYLKPVLGWCYLGLSLNIICVSFMILLVFRPKLAQRMLMSVVYALGKVRFLRRINQYTDKIRTAMKQYEDVSEYFQMHKLVILNVVTITIIQRFVLFFVTYLTYRSFGFSSLGLTTIVILQGMISVAVDMLPLPGGMGISEKLFLLIFTPLLGKVTLSVMIVSRGLSYYTELTISALLTAIAHFALGRKKGRKTVKYIIINKKHP